MVRSAGSGPGPIPAVAVLETPLAGCFFFKGETSRLTGCEVEVILPFDSWTIS